MSEGAIIDMMDEEYAIPGELGAYTSEHRRIEAWPDKAKRQIVALERRALALEGKVRHLEALVHRLVNASEGLE